MADPVLTPDELVAALERGQSRLAKVLRRRGMELAFDMKSKAVGNVRDRTKRRTGSLLRSIAGTVQVQGSTVSPTLSAGGHNGGAALVYARIQEKGGTVRPKKAGGWLAIPGASVRTDAGVARFPSPRNYPGKLFFQQFSSGQARLAELVGGKPVTRWHLRKQTVIKPKNFLRDAWRDVSATVPSVLSDVVRVAYVTGDAGTGEQ